MNREKTKTLAIVALAMGNLALLLVIGLNWEKITKGGVSKSAERKQLKRERSHAQEAERAESRAAAVRGSIREKTSELQKCYEAHLRDGTTIVGGAIRVSWTIDPDGHVKAASLVESDFNEAGKDGLAVCVLSEINKWTFEASRETEPIPVTHRFIFKRKMPTQYAFE